MNFVIDDQSGQRLDIYAHNVLPGLSRSSVQKLISDGSILVNGKKEKTGYKLKPGNKITINYDSEQQEVIPKITLPVLYEDEDCIVIEKPVGLLTHSKGAFNPEATVATFIAPRLKDMFGDRGGIVHRLDRATSGVMICAKNKDAQDWLQKQFAQRKTKKTYLAIIEGKLSPEKAVIDMPIERDPHHPKQFRVGKNGRLAQTQYIILDSNSKYSLLELKPVTGRTHQLRVHLKQLGHPIVGDELYGGHSAPRLMLHAASLELTLPNRQRKTFTSKTPHDFSDIMK